MSMPSKRPTSLLPAPLLRQKLDVSVVNARVNNMISTMKDADFETKRAFVEYVARTSGMTPSEFTTKFFTFYRFS